MHPSGIDMPEDYMLPSRIISMHRKGQKELFNILFLNMAFYGFLAAMLFQPVRCIAAEVFREDFEDAQAGDRWIADRGVWEIGVPTSGPNAAHSGSNVLATILSGNYTDDISSRVEGPSFVVPAAGENPRLRFWHWWDFSTNDFGRVEIKVGTANWKALSVDYTASSSGQWTRAQLDLSAYEGQTVQLGFWFESHRWDVSAGWYIDEVVVETGALPIMISVENFEDMQAADRWVADRGVWEVGIPTSGPKAAHSGSNVLATILSGNYTDDRSSRVASPSFVVPAAGENPRLRFWHWWNFSTNDLGRVEIKAGTANWKALSMDYTASSSGQWTRAQLDLSAYAGQTVQLGFWFESHRWDVSAGWYIDEVVVETGALPIMISVENFEDVQAADRWVADRGVWEAGVPTSGPNKAHSGSNVLATILSGNYTDDRSSRVEGPSFVVPAAGENPRLRFWHWWNFSTNDLGRVEIKVGTAGWIPLSINYTASSSGQWTRAQLDLSAYAGQTVQFGFWFESHRWDVGPGWYIDEVEIIGLPPSPLSIATASALPSAVVGSAYNATLSAWGGTSPYSWSIIAGSLPAGLSLSTSGTISGTPSAVSITNFVVQVTDGASRVVTKELTLAVVQPNPVPVTTGISPNSMSAGGPGFEIIVAGSNFLTGSTVLWSGQPLSTTFLSGTLLRAAVPAAQSAAASTVNVTVSNSGPGGGVSNAQSFAIVNPVPAVFCLNPISIVTGGKDFSLIVYGINFTSQSRILWNGESRTTTYVSSTQLQAAITANDIKTAGTVNVSVTNPTPGGGQSNNGTISIVTLSPGAPTITSISPDNLPAGGDAVEVTVNGTGFTSGSEVQFNGQNRATKFISDKQLTATLLADDIAIGLTNAITVVNPSLSNVESAIQIHSMKEASEGPVSNTSVITVLNPVPLLTGVTPPSTKAGDGAISLITDGEKFVSNSKVRWNGLEKETTFTNKSRLGGKIVASDVEEETKGNASITIANPGPGGGVSNALNFAIRTKKSSTDALYYPRLESSSSGMTGIAVVNLSGKEAILNVWAYSDEGEELKGPDITNPAAVTIGGAEQIAILESQLFGKGLPVKAPLGWVKVESTEPELAGFFLSLDPDLKTMDGADVSLKALSLFVFPEIEGAEGFTQINIANPDATETGVTFELHGSDGKIRGAAVDRKIKPNGHFTQTLEKLFTDMKAEPSDYVRVSTTHGVVPFEYLGRKGKYVEGLNGQDGITGSTILYSPQYALGGGYMTLVSIVNLELLDGTVTLELIGDDGKLIGEAKKLSIAAGGKLHLTDQKLFLDAGDQAVAGYLKITSSGPKLTGSVIFGDPKRESFSSALPLTGTLLRSFLYGQIASNDQYFTGMAILNPNEVKATAAITVHDKKGNILLSKTETIEGKQRIAKLINQYFPQLNGQSIAGGYITITSDQDVASFALFGTLNLSVLSAIPPQVVK
jgi:hypothetical protein